MKKRTTLQNLTVLFLLFSTVAFSQVTNNIPDLLHFTAVARYNNTIPPAPIPNTNVLVRIEVFQGIPLPNNSNKIYCEQASATTNLVGEFSVNFPDTSVNAAICTPFNQLNSVQWETGDKHVKVSFQENPSLPWEDIATFQFTTVPFAFASRTAESITNFDLTGAVDGNVIKYNATTQKWEAANASGTQDNWGTQVVQRTGRLSGDGTATNPLDIASQGASQGQVMTFDNGSWKPQTPSPVTGDNWGNQTTQVTGRLTGNGTPSNPLDLASQGAISGQVLKYNGSNWAPAQDLTTTGTVNVDITGINGIDVTENPSNSNNFTITTDAIRPNTQASGDITGTYQNLQIGFAAVGSDEIGNNAIGNNEMANDAVGSNEIINGSVAAVDLNNMGATQGQVLVYNNGWGPGAVLAPVPEIYIFEERYEHILLNGVGPEPTTANNQAPVGNAFNTRNINTQVYPVSGGPGNVTLGGSGNLTFKPGTYLIDASAPAWYVLRHKLFLRRSDNIIELTGTDEYARQNEPAGNMPTGADHSRSFVKGVLVVPPGPDRIVKLDHYLQVVSPGASELGVDGNQADVIWNTIKHVYATITIQKI
jgi:hypothetical protein